MTNYGLAFLVICFYLSLKFDNIKTLNRLNKLNEKIEKHNKLLEEKVGDRNWKYE